MVSGINCRNYKKEKVDKGNIGSSTQGAISTAQIKDSVNKILGYHGDLGQEIQILGQQWV